MRKHRQQHGTMRSEAKLQQHQPPLQGQESFARGMDLTPGRAPAEGPAIEIASPSHERWEQGTAERAPAEGPDIVMPSQKRPNKG